VIIVLGLAGSGKSTQSQMLANRDNFSWLSMGELLRSIITDERKEEMLAGKVLDEHDVITILDTELQKRGDVPELILDGFPRGILQADWLLEQQNLGRFSIRAVIHLYAHKETVKERLLARGRQDDTEEAIQERFHEYENTIKPIINTMRDNNIPIVEVNAEQSPEVVLDSIVKDMSQIGISV
jgi:adenylate kinase